MIDKVNWLRSDCRFGSPYGLEDALGGCIRPGDILYGSYGLSRLWLVVTLTPWPGWQLSKRLLITVLNEDGLVTVYTYPDTLVRRLGSTGEDCA